MFPADQPLGDKAELLYVFRWLIDGLPVWLQPWFLMLFFLSIFVGVRLLVENKEPQFYEQYRGIWPGDAFLSIAFALMVIAYQYYIPVQHNRWWQSGYWQIGSVVAATLITGGLAAVEYHAAIKYRKRRNDHYGYVPPHVYTLRQLHSPTCLLHRLFMWSAAYLFIKMLGGMFTWWGEVPWLLSVSVIVLLGAWAFCGLYIDNVAQRPDLEDVHPNNGWFPNLQAAVAWLWRKTFGRRSRPAQVGPLPSAHADYGHTTEPLMAGPARDWPPSLDVPRRSDPPPVFRTGQGGSGKIPPPPVGY